MVKKWLMSAEWMLKYQVQFDFERFLWPLNNATLFAEFPFLTVDCQHTLFKLAVRSCLGVAWPDPTDSSIVTVGPRLCHYLGRDGTFKRWDLDGRSESVRWVFSVIAWLHFLPEFSLLSEPLRWKLNNSVWWAQIKLLYLPWLPCHSCHVWLSL